MCKSQRKHSMHHCRTRSALYLQIYRPDDFTFKKPWEASWCGIITGIIGFLGARTVCAIHVRTSCWLFLFNDSNVLRVNVAVIHCRARWYMGHVWVTYRLVHLRWYDPTWFALSIRRASACRTHLRCSVQVSVLPLTLCVWVVHWR